MAQHENSILTQNAYVVRDIRESMNMWMDNFGVGPFFLMNNIVVDDVTYRGKPAELELSAAIAYSGNVQIELIVQHSDGPSAYRDVVPKGQEGFHHICTYPDDYDAELARFEAAGFPAATTGLVKSSGTRFCYMDAREKLNCMIELVDMPGGPMKVWAPLKEIADNWDGKTDPIREFDL